MTKTTGVVQINGAQYDALSGQLLSAVQNKISFAKMPKTGSAMDGFISRPAKVALSGGAATKEKIHRAAKARAKYTAQQVHRRTTKSQTLMRRAVAKKAVDSAIKASPSYNSVINKARLSRAMAASKHTQVKHFGKPAKSALQHKAHTKPQIRSEVFPKPRTVPSAAASAPAMPSLVTSVSHKNLERMLDEALIKADSHKQAMHKRSRGSVVGKLFSKPKWWVLVAGFLVIMGIAAFVAMKYVPSVSVKVAAMRADVSASLPTYTPGEYQIKPGVAYKKGTVSMHYVSRSDKTKAYDVVQQATTSDSASLAASIVQNNSQVQTSNVKGTTVYIYGSGNEATWVNNGKRYTITGNANLPSDQILKIAESL